MVDVTDGESVDDVATVSVGNEVVRPFARATPLAPRDLVVDEITTGAPPCVRVWLEYTMLPFTGGDGLVTDDVFDDTENTVADASEVKVAEVALSRN